MDGINNIGANNQVGYAESKKPERPLGDQVRYWEDEKNKVDVPDQEIDKDLFLQMLVTQMRNQNPLDGGEDMGDFITQMTMFTVVEQVTQLKDAIEEQGKISNSHQALNLLNRQVGVKNDSGDLIEGEVKGVNFRNDQTYITINDREYLFSNVVSVGDPAEEPIEDPEADEEPVDEETDYGGGQIYG